MGRLHGARHIGGCGGSTGFNVADPLEVRHNGVTAFGVAGFVPPSLPSINYHAPYLHNGKAQTSTRSSCCTDWARGRSPAR
jgi:hypothetical protein